MSEFDKLILSLATAMVVIYLVGPSALWGVTKEAAQWLLVIFVLIWAL